MFDDLPVLKFRNITIAHPDTNFTYVLNPDLLVIDYGLFGFPPFTEFVLDMDIVENGVKLNILLYIQTVYDYDEERNFIGAINCRFLSMYGFDLTAYHREIKFSYSFKSNDVLSTSITPDIIGRPVVPFIQYIVFTLYQDCLIALHSGCEAKLCRITDKQKRINERRIKDGKKPVYEEQTIKIKPSIYYKPTGQHRNYTPPCAHQRRGHFRTYQSGKRVWVKDCKVSQGSERTIKSDYVFEYDVV